VALTLTLTPGRARVLRPGHSRRPPLPPSSGHARALLHCSGGELERWGAGAEGELDPFAVHLRAVAAALRWLRRAAGAPAGPLPPSFGEVQRLVSCAITASLRAMQSTGSGVGKLPSSAQSPPVELALAAGKCKCSGDGWFALVPAGTVPP
jgi:hypothetical protein